MLSHRILSKICWDFIKQHMMDLSNEFYEGSMGIKRLNYDTITLLPKIKESIKIQ
jgi:hypothetical protein